MASGTAAPNWHSTLSGSVVDTVVLGSAWDTIQIMNRSGTSEIYYTVDGSTPTIGGVNTRVLPASICADAPPIPEGTPVTVKLLSSGTPTYSVIGGL